MNNFKTKINFNQFTLKNNVLLFYSIVFLSCSVHSQRVLFSENNNGNWDLYSIDLNNGAINRVTKDSLKDFQSDYCSVNNKIVFDSYRDSNTRNIFTINSKTNELNQLTHLKTRDGHPVWSPDCVKIAFQSGRSGNPDVFIMDSSGKNVEQLTFDTSFDGIPKWAPNGKLLAINSNRTGSPNVFLINFKTKEKIKITDDKKYNFVQDWISDTKILIITDVHEKRQLQILDIKNGSTKTISTDGDVTYARCNKKGQIVFTQKTNTGKVNVFLTDIKKKDIKQLTNSKNEKRFPAFMK